MNQLMLNYPGDSFWTSWLLGNGHMGQAMTFHPESGEIILSHNTFYSGEDDWESAAPGTAEAFMRAREATCRQEWETARENIRAYLRHKGNYGSALPVGTLRLEQQFDEDWQDYQRSLDLMGGVARCSFRHGNAVQEQEAFCSHPDKVFVLRVRDSAGSTVRISLSDEYITASAQGHELFFTAKARETRHSDGQCGVTLRGRIRLEAEDGCIQAEEAALCVTGAKEWRLYMAMETDFAGDQKEPVIGCTDYDALFNRHSEDFIPRMKRVELNIPGQEETCRMVNLGRYLLLSGAREDAALPMSLQGVWNDNVACNLDWTCDMHLDVNTQMNYWLSGIGALAECRAPLFRWMEERVIPHGRQAAREHYGMPGWTAELVSNAWGWARPIWYASLAPCPGCSAWEATDYMEHVRYTGDMDFLREHALPVIEESAEFFLAYLFEHEGELVGGPSISPENGFLWNGKRYDACLNATFETASIRQIFTDVQEARRMLDMPEDPRIADALARLAKPRITADGMIAEWSHDLPPADPQHRHTSHLVGLYPYGQINPQDTPELARAAQASIQRRLEPYDNWEDTGWARTMLAMYAARLWDGEQAGFHLNEMLRVLTTPNGLVMHPVTRGTGTEKPVWELDGNTGFAAAALETLLQSHNGVIRLLPALPPEWQEGSFKGLMARGGVRVDAAWEAGRLTQVVLCAQESQVARVAWQDKQLCIGLEAGVPTVIGENDWHLQEEKV